MALVRELLRRIEKAQPTRATVTQASLSPNQFAQYSPVIRRQAMIIARRAGGRVEVSDLCASGFAGLIEALLDYGTLGSGLDHDGYVRHRIHAAMIEHVEAIDPDVREAKDASRRIVEAIRLLVATRGRDPERREIASALGLDGERYEELLERIHARGAARLLVRDPRRRLRAPRSEATPSLERAIELRSGRERELLCLVFVEGCTAPEAAARLGCTEREVVLAMTESIHRVRASLGLC